MSVYDFYQRKTKVNGNSTGKNYSTLGEKLKSDSDTLMELTWNGDPQSKIGYIYDYIHDDQPDIKDHMTYENTTKTRIDVKLIVKSYSSLDQDQPEFYCQFKPSQKIEFEEDDELYYYETNYRKKYGMEFPIGMMLDLPDDKGVYHKWLICEREIANQFPKYLILPIDYQFMWIEKDGENIYKRKMWGVNRSQKSYTIGVYTDRYFTRPDNQAKAFLPLNPITERLWYTDKEDTNMRMVVSAKTEHPIVWKLTKIENASPLGIQVLTFYQNYWNSHRDYIEKDADGNIIGMWADYFDSEITPTDPDTKPTLSPVTNILATITSSISTIKVGGSYRTLNIKFSNDSGEDVTDIFGDSKSNFDWHFEIDNEEYKGIIRNDLSFCQMKIKFPDDYDYVGKILTIYCTITNETITIESNKLQLEITD